MESRSALLLPGVLLFLLVGVASASRQLLAAKSSELADGSSCHLPTDLAFKAPFCKGGALNCLIRKLPAKAGKPLRGVCTSNYAKGSYCTVGEFNFAVGAKRIPAYGPTTCETCSCKYHPSKKGSNKASCDCDPLPACYVDSAGATVGNGCPYQIQSMCVITKPGEGILINGKQTSLGRCQAPQVSACVSAGPTWGPFWYAQGATSVPQPGNRCYSCTCGAGGVIKHCKKIEGCKNP